MTALWWPSSATQKFLFVCDYFVLIIILIFFQIFTCIVFMCELILRQNQIVFEWNKKPNYFLFKSKLKIKNNDFVLKL